MNDKETKKLLAQTYAEFYKLEIDRKEKLNSRLPLLIGIDSVLLGVIGSFLNDLPECNAEIARICFYFFLVTQLAALVASIIFTTLFVYIDNATVVFIMTAEPIIVPFNWYRNLIGKRLRRRRNKARKKRRSRTIIRRIKKPMQRRTVVSNKIRALYGITAYMKKMEAYNALLDVRHKLDLSDELISLLCKQYGRASTYQFQINRNKVKYFNAAFRLLIIALALAFLCGLSYFYMKHSAQKNVLKVEVVISK